MKEVSDETKLEIAAKAMFTDCLGDDGYPFKTWEEQAKEMADNCSKEFIERCYELNKEDYNET